MQDRNWLGVTVENYPNLAAAKMAQSFLEAEGIHASIPDEFLAGVDWQLGTAIQGVRLQVDPASEDSARRVLAEAMAASALEDESSEESAAVACPYCSSDLVGPATWRKRLKAVSMILPFALLLWPLFVLLGKRFSCGACGRGWG